MKIRFDLRDPDERAAVHAALHAFDASTIPEVRGGLADMIYNGTPTNSPLADMVTDHAGCTDREQEANMEWQHERKALRRQLAESAADNTRLRADIVNRSVD